MKKKLLSLVLAGALVLSCNSIAFAADETKEVAASSGVYQTEITGDTTVEVPEIKIVVPTSVNTVINPYKLEVEVNSDKVTDQIVSATQEISSESNVPISISTTATATAAGNATIATAAVKDTEKANSVFSYLEIVEDGTDFAAAFDTKAANQVVFSAKGTIKKDMFTLDAGGSGDAKKAQFKILGSAAKAPETVWSADDKITYGIVFNFAPKIETE